MNEYSCALTSCGKHVNVLSDIDVGSKIAASSFLSLHSDMTVSAFSPTTPYTIRYKNTNDRIFHFGPEVVDVSFPWEVMGEGQNLLYLAYPYIEYQMQLAGFVTAHAACAVDDNGEAVLILGKEGAGKTSVAITLCRSGYTLLGNDLVVLGFEGNEATAVSGIKFFFLRYESARRNLPDLLTHFSKPVTDPWLTKTVIMPQDLGVKIHSGKARITKAFLVHVDQGQTKLHAQNGDSLVTRLFLHENFSRYIRNTCTTMLVGPKMEFAGYIPSLDTPACYRRRESLMNYLLQNLGIQYVSGSLNEVAGYINSPLSES